MDKAKIEAAPKAGGPSAEQEKSLEEKVGKKFDEIFDWKKHKNKLKIFSKQEKENIELAREVMKENVINAAVKDSWKEDEITEKIIEHTCENIRELAVDEGIDGKNRDEFVFLIKKICDETKTADS